MLNKICLIIMLLCYIMYRRDSDIICGSEVTMYIVSTWLDVSTLVTCAGEDVTWAEDGTWAEGGTT